MKNFYEYIDDYVNDNLNEADRQAFNDQMSNDSGLRQAVEDYDVVEIVLDGLLEEEIRNVVESKQTEAKVRPMNAAKERKGLKASAMKPIKFLIATAAILLAVLAYTQLMPSTPENITIAQVYDEPAWPSSDRGENVEEFSKEFKLYKEGDKEGAIKALSNYNTPDAQYWISEIYLKEKQLNKVLESLPNAYYKNDVNRRDRINFMKIVSLHFNKEILEANEQIRSLPPDTNPYYLDKCKSLLKE